MNLNLYHAVEKYLEAMRKQSKNRLQILPPIAIKRRFYYKTFINRKIWIISTFLHRAVTETDLTLYLHRG